MIYTDPQAAAGAFRAAIDGAERILLLSHVNPDGDAIGSLLGVAHALLAIGKQPIVVASSELPSYSAGLPGIELAHTYQRGEPLPASDLIWMVDTASLERVGAIFEEHQAELAARPLIIVDHHVTNSGGGDVNLIQPAAASCAELLFELLGAMGLPLGGAAATCLLMGTLTDTQSFQTPGAGPLTLRRSAAMLEAGADKQAIVDAVYFAIPTATLRLTGMAMAGLQREGGLLWTSVTQAMLRAAAAADEATDDTVGRMQRAEGMRACVLFRERADGSVKISLRSVPGVDVAAVAKIWGGGGHRQAAGATLMMGLAAAEAAVLPALRQAMAAPAEG